MELFRTALCATVALGMVPGAAIGQSQPDRDVPAILEKAPEAKADKVAELDGCMSQERPTRVGFNDVRQVCGTDRFLVVSNKADNYGKGVVIVSLDGEIQRMAPGQRFDAKEAKCRVIYYAPIEADYMIRVICE